MDNLPERNPRERQQALLAEAGSLLDQVKGEEVGNTIKQKISQIRRLKNGLERLHTEGESALPGIISSFDLKTTNYTNTTAAIELKLVDAVKELKNSDLVRNLTHEAIGANKTTFVEAGESFMKKVWNRHNAFLDSKPQGARFGIALGEMAVGSIITQVGGQWVTQAVSGLKDGSFTQSNTQEGGRSTTLVMLPMSAQERVIKGALGAAGVGLGIGGTVVGMMSLFRN